MKWDLLCCDIGKVAMLIGILCIYHIIATSLFLDTLIPDCCSDAEYSFESYVDGCYTSRGTDNKFMNCVLYPHSFSYILLLLGLVLIMIVISLVFLLVEYLYKRYSNGRVHKK